ncbi:MAG: hypothetical protein WBE61_01015, partial [Nitrososphaeraceae archaeon]
MGLIFCISSIEYWHNIIFLTIDYNNKKGKREKAQPHYGSPNAINDPMFSPSVGTNSIPCPIDGPPTP